MCGLSASSGALERGVRVADFARKTQKTQTKTTFIVKKDDISEPRTRVKGEEKILKEKILKEKITRKASYPLRTQNLRVQINRKKEIGKIGEKITRIPAQNRNTQTHVPQTHQNCGKLRINSRKRGAIFVFRTEIPKIEVFSRILVSAIGERD